MARDIPRAIPPTKPINIRKAYSPHLSISLPDNQWKKVKEASTDMTVAITVTINLIIYKTPLYNPDNTICLHYNQ